MKLTYHDQTIDYHVQYSKRKTLAIGINQDGNIVVKAPVGIPQERIAQLVTNKAPWIIKKLDEHQKRAVPKKKYVNGELFLFQGKEYPLEITLDKAVVRAHLIFDAGFKITTPTKDLTLYRDLLEIFYRKATRMLVLERINHYKKYIQVEPNRVVIKQQKTRWGSCSSLKNLNFNWKLSMAPPYALDYVVVHEMCHLRHMNHSKDFWQLVENILPNYHQGKAWLKENAPRLNLY
ncbi:M48 family metallopeptidase [Vallitalea pronyensis]|uniref:M48 family metallopeptidase n=1 Tax=Vallitalea pronyensis TaxID=1348613 RepID=A0A8J8MJP7_9FIRM|nr:SprT family zinc-dependent metalloprotease [Vallitalea pronyensis]QUI23057.1 M48 family metallopeptidase [Vallitalea pronyensis]